MAELLAFIKPYILPFMAQLILELLRQMREDPAYGERVEEVHKKYSEAQAKGDENATIEAVTDFQRLLANRKPQ